MRKCVHLAVALVLLCVVRLGSAQGTSTSVDPEQEVVLLEIASQWSALQDLTSRPWTASNIQYACTGGIAYVSSCNGTGWLQEMEIGAFSTPPYLGALAPSLGKMAALVSLKIDSAVGGVPEPSLGNLKELKELTFDRCKFTSALPSEWSGMTKLETFAYYSTLDAPAIPFPDFIQGMPLLKTVDLQAANFTGSIPSFLGTLPSIDRIALMGIPLLTGPIPNSILQSGTLTQLALTFLTGFNATGPMTLQSDWSTASALVTITIYNVALTGNLPSKYPPGLFMFSVAQTGITGNIPQSLVDSPNLVSLSISYEAFTGMIPAPSNPATSRLNTYRVFNCKFTSVHPDILLGARLSVVDFSNNLISGNLPSKFPTYKDPWYPLTNLFLHGNSFVGPIPSSYFTSNPQLSILYLHENKLSGHLPIELANKTNWAHLRLNSNSFDGTIPDAGKWHLNDVFTIISMKDNYLSGAIPAGLFQRNGTAFTQFEFSGNRLNICDLPPNYTVPSGFATQLCNVSRQTPPECGCPDAWTSQCVFDPIPASCPPAEPLAPFPVAPFSLTPSPIPGNPSTGNPSTGSTPASPAPRSSASAPSFVSSILVFALSLLFALI